MNFADRDPAAQRLCRREQAHIIRMNQMPAQDIIGQITQRPDEQRTVLDLGAAQRLQQRGFKAVGDRHDLAGRFHLRAEPVRCTRKFLERKLRHLHRNIVQSGLKCRRCFAGDLIRDLIQPVADGDLCGDLCDRVSGCFGCECR